MGAKGPTSFLEDVEEAYPREPWEDDARCLDADPDAFFPSAGEWDLAEEAKRMCETCDVREECLELAKRIEGDADTFRYGVWGGTTPRERRRLARIDKLEEGRRMRLDRTG